MWQVIRDEDLNAKARPVPKAKFGSQIPVIRERRDQAQSGCLFRTL
jgi:hypothetical protein